MHRGLGYGVMAAVLACAAPAPQAQAWYRGGYGYGGAIVAGAALGVTAGVLASRPYYAAPYPYYPAPVYAVPAPYPYPYPPPGYAYAQPYPYPPPAPPPPAYAATQPAPGPACGPGRFFNSLTGNCDRR